MHEGKHGIFDHVEDMDDIFGVESHDHDHDHDHCGDGHDHKGFGIFKKHSHNDDEE